MSQKTPFIDSSTAVDAYDESRRWLRVYFEPCDEFERIARVRPSPDIAPDLPKVVDGTLAAIVQEDPKRIIQQVASGTIDCQDYPAYAKIAELVYTKQMIPLYNRMGSKLQKDWNMLGKAMTYGIATSYTFFTTTNGQMHCDFVIPYVKDVLIEKGKVFAPDSNIRFMRSWYQKRDIQAIINKEKAMSAKIKGYEPEWNLQALADFMENGASAKPADLQTPAEKEKGGDTGGFEVIHAFQKGVGAEMYSFAPRYEQGKTLRTKINDDPRGAMPLNDLYCNIDLSNPLGRGVIELSGGVQNLIDQQMQMFQFMSTMQMGPPLQVYGNVDSSKLKFRPNAIWKIGNLQQNKVEPYAVDNNAISNFANNYGLLKSQILNLNSSQDHSISSDAGNPAQSKTQAGVQASEARLGVSDNYLRKQFETWSGEQAETAINIQFAKMTGKQTIKLEGADLKDVMRSDAKEYLQDNELTIPYKDINKVAFKFQVDASSSEVKEDADNVEKLTEVLKVMQQSQDPTTLAKVPQVIKLIIDEIGAEGTDDLFPEQKDENGMPVEQQQPQMNPQMIQQMVQQTVEQALQADKQQPKTITESMRWTSADFTPTELAQLKQASGIQPDPTGVTPNEQAAHTDTILKADKQAHDTHLAVANHAHTVAQAGVQNEQAEQNSQMQHEQAMASNQDKQETSQQKQNPAEPLNNHDHPLQPHEEQLAQDLFHRGFNEHDVEQAVVMLRQSVPIEQVIQTLGAKHATR